MDDHDYGGVWLTVNPVYHAGARDYFLRDNYQDMDGTHRDNA